MGTLQIVLIVIASVLAFLLAVFAVAAVCSLNYVLRRKRKSRFSSYDPKAFGVDISWFDEVAQYTDELSITSFDGLKLVALRIAHETPSRRVAILQHGYLASPHSMQPQAKILFERGYDLIIPHARAHGKSEGEYIGMAWLDRFDVMRWLNKTVELFGSSVSIALVGVSMGGATVVAVSGMNPPPQLKCVVDDCGFSSHVDEYTACLKKAPFKPLLLLPLRVAVRLKLGYSISSADITKLAEKSKTPTLFFHGGKDDFVPSELGQKLFEACGASDKQIHIVENATHACSYVSDPELYTARLSEFVAKYCE